MAYGLVKCACGHITSLEYNAYINKSYWNKIDSQRYLCPICKSTTLYLITTYDPSLIVEKITVRTFGEIKDYYSSVEENLKKEPDSIRKLLTENYFKVSNESSKDYIIYYSPDEYKAIFKLKHKCKTQDLILLVPPNYEILKKIVEANKADKRLRKEKAPKKAPLPTTYKDFWVMK
jgi:hypothetical protein